MEKDHLFLGIFFVLLACACFACINVFASAGAGHASPYMMILFQTLFSFAFISPFVLHKGIQFLRTERLFLLFMRAFTGTLTLFLIFVALAYMPMTNATLLTYSAPLWMPIIGFVFLRQHIGWHVWISVMIGFAGIFLILKPNGQFHFSSIIAIAGAVSMAITYFFVRWLIATEPLLRIMFYYFFFGSILTLLFAPFFWETPDIIGWQALVGLGASLTLSQVFITLACHYMDPPRISPYIYSVIVFTALFDYLIWDETLTPIKYLGMLFVLIGGVLTATVEKRRNNLK